MKWAGVSRPPSRPLIITTNSMTVKCILIQRSDHKRIYITFFKTFCECLCFWLCWLQSHPHESWLKGRYQLNRNSLFTVPGLNQSEYIWIYFSFGLELIRNDAINSSSDEFWKYELYILVLEWTEYRQNVCCRFAYFISFGWPAGVDRSKSGARECWFKFIFILETDQ